MNAGEIPATFSIDSENTMPEVTQKFLKKKTNGQEVQTNIQETTEGVADGG